MKKRRISFEDEETFETNFDEKDGDNGSSSDDEDIIQSSQVNYLIFSFLFKHFFHTINIFFPAL